MTWEYLHLVSHSFPIVLSASGTAVGLYGWARGRESLERWGLLALVIAAAFVAPAYLTGLAAADVVTERTFVSPGAVQTHRFWATWAAVPVFTAGALAAFALRERDDRALGRFVLLVGALATVMIAIAAWQGAKIVHGPGAPEAALMGGVLQEGHEAVEDERGGQHGAGLQRALPEGQLRELAQH